MRNSPLAFASSATQSSLENLSQLLGFLGLLEPLGLMCPQVLLAGYSVHWARRRFAKKRKTEPDGNPRPVLIIIRGPDGRTLRSWEINESGEREGTDHKLQPRPQPDTRIGPGGHRADRRPARTGQLTGHQRVLAGAPPIHAPGRRLRRTLLLEAQLDEAQRSQTQVLLTGPGVHDFLVTRDGASRRLTAFLHGYCQERGIGYVRYTTAEGTRSYPTLPEGQPTIIRASDRD